MRRKGVEEAADLVGISKNNAHLWQEDGTNLVMKGSYPCSPGAIVSN